MDEEVELENLQFLGIYGILQETYKSMQQSRKIFTQIILAFILPLSLLSNSFLVSQHTQESTPQFLKLLDLVSAKRNYHVLFNFFYLIFSSIFTLLIALAIAYTAAACIFIVRDVSNFKHVVRVLPKVWRQLLVIFLCSCAALIAFGFVTYLVLCLIPVIEILIRGSNDHKFGININGHIFFFCIIFYFMGIWYLTIILQLSRMVTKLSVWLNWPLGKVQFQFYWYAVRPMLVRVVGRGESFILWALLNLLVEFVAEIVVYFVCKWYDCERVDKLALSDHFYCHLSAHYVRSKVDNAVHQSSASEIASCLNLVED